MFEHFKQKGTLEGITWSLDIPGMVEFRRIAAIAQEFGIERNMQACGTRCGDLSRGRKISPGMVFVWSVAGFGAAIVVFGLSQWFWLSLVVLIVAGALDNVSVVIRATVVQLHTPDALRGRVSAVNRVFISSSNELGAFESGLLAALTSPVFTAVFGGVATIAFVLAALRLFPEVRRVGRLGN